MLLAKVRIVLMLSVWVCWSGLVLGIGSLNVLEMHAVLVHGVRRELILHYLGEVRMLAQLVKHHLLIEVWYFLSLLLVLLPMVTVSVLIIKILIVKVV